MAKIRNPKVTIVTAATIVHGNEGPYLFVSVKGAVPTWKAVVEQYEFARGIISGFAYIDYYTTLATVRGAIARRGEAVTFAVDPGSQRRVLDSLSRSYVLE